MPLLRTTLLRAEPAGTLHSLDELFALANAMEHEAATKYAELAEEMQRQGRPDLVAVFAELAAAEREHVDSVQRWSQSLRGKPPDPALVRWEAPVTFDPETSAEIKASRLTTPYRALAMAVQNEERAFAFWSYVAASAQDAEIKRTAEAMAREELGHVSTLRKERRRAYHREHGRKDADGLTRAAPSQVDAGRLELRLAAHLADAERCLQGRRRRVRASFSTRRWRWPIEPAVSAASPAPLNSGTLKSSPRPWPKLTSKELSARTMPSASKSCSDSRRGRS
jgi:rubrerythrin